MGEILRIHVGECGNRLGAKWLEGMNQEHGLDENGVHVGDDDQQLEHIGVHFEMQDRERYLGAARNYITRGGICGDGKKTL